jgi:hypothetical protein
MFILDECINSGILFSHKEEWNTDTGYNVKNLENVQSKSSHETPHPV